jgi:hypothetical protein
MATSIRDNLNGSEIANKLPDVALSIGLGEIISYLLAKAAYTETGITVTSNVATLAAQPSGLFQCVGITSGAASTVKKLLRGPISGTGAIVPATGECVWDGGLKVLFASGDAAATASFTYVVSTDTASVTKKALGQ